MLSTLAACVNRYSAETTAEWSSKIWDALKFEIWNGENEDFIQGALEVLRVTADSLGNRRRESDAPLTNFVVAAATECKNRFHDSRKLYLVSSGRILRAIALPSPYALHLVTKTVLPALHVLWQDLKLPSEKKMLLTVYNYILDARIMQDKRHPRYPGLIKDLYLAQKDDPQRDLLVRSFEGFRDGIVEVYFGAIGDIQREPSSSNELFGVPAIEGLVLLFQIPSYLSAVEQGMIVVVLNAILFQPSQDNEIRNAVLSSLQKISAMEPETFHEITLTTFMNKLPDTMPDDEEERKARLEVIVEHLQDLVEIACSQPCKRQLQNGTPINTASSYWHRNFDAMVNKLLEKLDIVLQKADLLEYANIILAAICGGLQYFETNLNLARANLARTRPPEKSRQVNEGKLDESDPAYENQNKTEPSPLDPKIGPYSYIIKALFQKVVQQKDGTSGPYKGIKDTFDEKFVQLVGRTAMWALRSDLTTPANSILLNWNSLHPDQPSVIWTLFIPGPSQEQLSDTQQDLRKGPEDKCLANVLSLYLLAGHRLSEPSIVSPCASPNPYILTN